MIGGASWTVTKVIVDRDATPPEEPLLKLQTTIQNLVDGGATIFAVIQDITDGSWVIISSG